MKYEKAKQPANDQDHSKDIEEISHKIIFNIDQEIRNKFITENYSRIR